MEKVYYLTKTVVSLPCMGLIPLGVYAMCVALSRADYGIGALFVALAAIYVWAVWKFSSPEVNPAFIKSSGNSRVFIGVNTVVTLIFTLVVLLAGACLWPLLYPAFMWLGVNCLDVQMTDNFEFWWVYLCAYVLFKFGYLLLWEYVRAYRWIRKLTLPDTCW